MPVMDASYRDAGYGYRLYTTTIGTRSGTLMAHQWNTDEVLMEHYWNTHGTFAAPKQEKGTLLEHRT